MATLKRGGESADRRNYRNEILAERLSRRTEDHYVSPEMAWGSEFEPIARYAYEIATGEMVDTVGFVLHPTMDFAGASPDGLVGEDGGLELKCPKTTTHIKWMTNGGVPEEHQAQCLWNMACAERQWWDFMSFDPRLPDGLRIFIARMERDEASIKLIEEEVARFNDEVEAACSALRVRVREVPPAPVDPRSDYEQLMSMIDAQELVP
jgi:putative phage-type endonuclease